MSLAKYVVPANEVHYEFEIAGLSEFQLTRFELHEALNEIGYLDVDLINVDTSIDLASAMGKKASLKILAGTEDDRQARYYHGIVQRFELTGTDDKAAYYSARVVPRLWKLGRKHKSRVHVTEQSQRKTFKDVVEKVLQEGGLSGTSVSFKLNEGDYQPFSFLTQYRETDLDFIKRLCEEDGVGFSFDHTEEEEVLQLFDSNQKLKEANPYSEVIYRHAAGMLEDEYESIQSFQVSHQLDYGKVEMREYDFKDSQKKISGDKTGKSDDSLEYYDYAVKFQDEEGATERMKKTAKLRSEEYDAGVYVGTGRGDYRSMAAGKLFTLSECPSDALNKQWLPVEVVHRGTESNQVAGDGAPLGMGGYSYSMEFKAMPADVTFRPKRKAAKPIVLGSQTATVVGPAGEEIHTDEHGRVRVRMHWDRERQKEEDSSFWIRVSQQSAGRMWGMFFLPRIGQEVVVDFLEGDPNHPIITGSVYNDYQLPPYRPVPENKTRSTIKTNSTPGGNGFNELRFEDKKGSEQVFMHAEKNFDLRVKNDGKETYGNNHHLVVGGSNGGDQHERYKNDRHVIVEKNHYEKIESERKLKVGGDQIQHIDGDFFNDVGGDRLMITSGDSKNRVTGDSFHTVTGDLEAYSAAEQRVGAMRNVCISSVSGSVFVAAVQQIQLSVGPSFIKIDNTGVTIEGPMVKVNSGGIATPNMTKFKQPEVRSMDEADPAKAADADNDTSGEKSAW
ncbi:Phage-related baseplate assembly protein [Planctomycetes bacterium Pan216]|uniref:Phage-related baseplate assembly protein n=1 Tax=Kolteria novifilia TaxID=2527975 RepID=A0A518B563_9BACT|nr:Phage-related baseplate assembly protein [Planctomycetes bacterium Pan216]